MCGLVLVLTKNKNGFTSEQNNVFNTLLYMSGHFRGRDGAGVVHVDNIGNVKLAKAALTVDEFIRTKEYSELETASFQRGWAMFGHNRAATRGVVNDANSHPFVVDDKIVLVHNGTFQGDHKKIKDTEVDSEAIAHAISEGEDVEKTLRTINAAYALMWYNVEKKELNVIRNSQRPLWYMETHDSYIYASEEVFLNFVKEKFKLTVRKNPFEIKDSTLSKFILEDGETKIECVDMDISYWKHNPSTGGTSGTRGPFPGMGQRWNNETKQWEGYEKRSAADDAELHAIRRNALACAWGGYGAFDSDDDVVLPPTPSPRPPADTRDGAARERVIKALGKTIQPTLFKRYAELKDNYTGTQTLRCIVNDLVESDDDPKTNNYLLIGKTLDDNELQVVFPIRGMDLNKVIDLTNDAVWEITYNGMSWQRVDHIPVQEKDHVDAWNGFCLMHGVNPQPIFMSGNNNAPAC